MKMKKLARPKDNFPEEEFKLAKCICQLIAKQIESLNTAGCSAPGSHDYHQAQGNFQGKRTKSQK